MSTTLPFTHPLVLASGSPRRRELLTSLGVALEIIPANIDESVRADEDPATYVRRLSQNKALAVSVQQPGRLVLAADTTVVLEHQILGKPNDANDARKMLASLSGRIHLVLTAVAIRGTHSADVVVTSKVHFRPLSQDMIDWYVATGEPLDKAGSYAIQGLGALFVQKLEGSPSNVIGLPLIETVELLHQASFPIAWRP